MKYHDHEWGRAVTDDTVLFEKLCLEGFQSGLSWLTVLRKREAFREVFGGFDPEVVAAFDESDIARLLTDARIIRHRGKIAATINNARVMLELYENDQTLAGLMWSYQPTTHEVPIAMSDIPATTAESKALSKQLKKLGFKFVGPTTTYAAMQAMGVVNDHLETCFVRSECELSRQEAISRLKVL